MSDTTIVYAVNDFAAIARRLRELNGAPQHHGTALAVIEAPTPRRGVRELLEEQRDLLMRQQHAQQACQNVGYGDMDAYQQARELLEEQRDLLMRQQHAQHVQQHFNQPNPQQCQTLGYGHSHQQALADPGHSHGMQAVASRCVS